MSRYGQPVVEAVDSGVTRFKKGNEVLDALSGLSNFSPTTPCPKVFTRSPPSNQLEVLIWRKPCVEVVYPARKKHKTKDRQKWQKHNYSNNDQSRRGHVRPQRQPLGCPIIPPIPPNSKRDLQGQPPLRAFVSRVKRRPKTAHCPKWTEDASACRAIVAGILVTGLES